MALWPSATSDTGHKPADVAFSAKIIHAVRMGAVDLRGEVGEMHGDAAEAVGLSVVVPVFNEAKGIAALVLDLEHELLALGEPFEVIMVDDCSTDESPRILDHLSASREWLHVHHAEDNAGHGPSVIRGLELARGEWIFQLDSDRQFLVAEFGDLWERRHGADLVLGVRADRDDPLHRIVLSRTVSLVVSALALRRLRDPNVPFRLYRRQLWEDLRQFMGPKTLAPSIFITLGAVSRGWRILEVPVTHLRGTREVSTLRKWRLVKFSLGGLRELVSYRYKLARHGRAPVLVARETA
jgi:glycosyltransferase involved in cell wall biosynthesis